MPSLPLMTNLQPSKIMSHPFQDVAVFAQKDTGVLCKTEKMISISTKYCMTLKMTNVLN